MQRRRHFTSLALLNDDIRTPGMLHFHRRLFAKLLTPCLHKKVEKVYELRSHTRLY